MGDDFTRRHLDRSWTAYDGHAFDGVSLTPRDETIRVFSVTLTDHERAQLKAGDLARFDIEGHIFRLYRNGELISERQIDAPAEKERT